MTSVNHFVVTIELSQTYLDTALVKALKELSANREVVNHHCNLHWKVFIKLSAGLPLSVDLTVTFREDWTSKSKPLVEFNSSSSIKNGRPAVFLMSV